MYRSREWCQPNPQIKVGGGRRDVHTPLPSIGAAAHLLIVRIQGVDRISLFFFVSPVPLCSHPVFSLFFFVSLLSFSRVFSVPPEEYPPFFLFLLPTSTSLLRFPTSLWLSSTHYVGNLGGFTFSFKRSLSIVLLFFLSYFCPFYCFCRCQPRRLA